METNVDLERLRAARDEHRHKFMWEWALRLAKSTNYADAASVKAELASMGFDDVDEVLGDEDLELLQVLCEAAVGTSGGRSDARPQPRPSPSVEVEAAHALAGEPAATDVSSHEDLAPAADPGSAAPPAAHTSRSSGRQSGRSDSGNVIGRLTRVSPAEVWRSSNFDLSDWLITNADVAREVLGFELRRARTDPSVRRSSVEDEAGRRVVVVSHLDGTAHEDLGEVVARLSASEAEVAVWIASDPRSDDLLAVDWLNRLGANVFLLRLEAVRIDNSAPAPLLTRIAPAS